LVGLCLCTSICTVVTELFPIKDYLLTYLNAILIVCPLLVMIRGHSPWPPPSPCHHFPLFIPCTLSFVTSDSKQLCLKGQCADDGNQLRPMSRDVCDVTRTCWAWHVVYLLRSVKSLQQHALQTRWPPKTEPVSPVATSAASRRLVG